MRLAAMMAAMMMTVTMFAQSNDSIIPAGAPTRSLTTDSTMWFNQTQELSGVVVKGRLPKTRMKGDAMRTTVAGTILEKAGTVSDALSKIPSLEAERDGGVKVLGRGDAEVYINGRRVQDVKELSRLRSDQIQHVDVVQNPGARYAASTKAVVRITLKKAQGEGFSFQDYIDGMYQYGYTLTNNLNLNYRTGGLDVTASLWAGRYGHAKSLQEHELTYFVGNDYYKNVNSQESKSIWKGLSPQLQVNYMVDENHSFGAFYKYDLTLGVQRDFRLRGFGIPNLGTLTADLRCVDVLNTNKTEAVIYGVRELTTSNPARRTFMLDLTWKFNEARSKYRGSGAGEKQKARM